MLDIITCIPRPESNVYKTFNSTFDSGFIQRNVSHANRYELVRNYCNFYAGAVRLNVRVIRLQKRDQKGGENGSV